MLTNYNFFQPNSNQLSALLSNLALQGNARKLDAYQPLGAAIAGAGRSVGQGMEQKTAYTEARAREKQRQQFATQERLGGQDFQAAQAELGRQLQREQAALGRALTREEMQQSTARFWAEYAQRGSQFSQNLAARQAEGAAGRQLTREEMAARTAEAERERAFRAGEGEKGRTFQAGEGEKGRALTREEIAAREAADLRESIRHYTALKVTPGLTPDQIGFIDRQIEAAQRKLGGDTADIMPTAQPAPTLPPEGGWQGPPRSLEEAKQRREAERNLAIQKNKDMSEGIAEFEKFVPTAPGRPLSETASTKKRIAADLSRTVVNEGKLVRDIGGTSKIAQTPGGRVLRSIAAFMNRGMSDEEIMSALANPEYRTVALKEGLGYVKGDMQKAGLTPEHLRTYMAWLRANYFK